jgi:NAD(P)-dependent dehydrogenase (short-subunit alcohol dehydrogenase family)
MGLLDGKVAIVTGGGRGIGRQHALLMAKEGADIVVNDLGASGRGEGADLTPAQEVVAEIEAGGGRAVVNGANVADWDAAEAMIQQAVDTFGKLDILVNNAGILRDRLTFNMTEEEFDVVVNVVLKGHFAPSRHAAAYWKALNKQTGEPVNAAIVNTSSEAGLYGNSGQANYGSAKAGLAAMTITMARDLSRIGVRANAICPGAITRLLATVVPGDSPEGAAPVEDSDEWSAMSPRAIAPLAAWLASDLAHDVNGQVFAVDGRRIQVLQGWNPVTQLESGGEWWTIEGLEQSRDVLFADRSTDIPPFMPQLGQ